jgi:NHLM bacteriocin system ABC transporter peptidase/ATP-binding protein
MSVAAHRAHTPTILQLEAVECGAACLGMILGYFGRTVPLEELRMRCGVSRDGSSAGNMVRAAKLYGLDAKGHRYEPDTIRELKPPFIVFWEFRHFVVVDGSSPKGVFLNDPAIGRRTVSWEEFDRNFTGVTITFEVTDAFEKNKARSSGLAVLAERLRESQAGVIYVILAGLGLVVPGLLFPALTKTFIDDVLVSGRTSWGVPVLGAIGLTILVQIALLELQQFVVLRLQTKIALSSASRFFWHVLNMPMDFYAQRSAGDLSYRVRLNDRVAQLLSGRITNAAVRLISAVFFLALMIRYDVFLSLVSVVVAALNIVALRAVNSRRADANSVLLQAEGELLATAVTGIRFIETLKAAGAETTFMQRWGSRIARVMNARQSFAAPSEALASTPRFLSMLNTIVILGFGGLRVMDGALSLGSLFAIYLLAGEFIGPFGEIVRFGAEFQEMEGSLKRLDDVYHYPAEVRSLSVPDTTPVRLRGGLELDDVTFGYSPVAPPLIEHFSLNLEPGQRVALVGSTGSGKSTVSKLVSGLYAPWSGTIRYDGYLRSAVDARSFAAGVSTVDQEIALFAGTVRGNITLWDPTLDDTAIELAARDASIHAEIIARPGGYDAVIEEEGRNLSGGQRQRLEIARALVRDPALIILDEATSALDPITEQLIAENLRRRGCSCLIVAHRLSTIRDCDEIIVMENGKIIERGTHDSLLAGGGRYVDLVTAV